MKTRLARAAVFAATRIVRDGGTRPSWDADPTDEVRDAYLSMFDVEADESTPKAKRRLQEAGDLAHALVQFANAVKGSKA